MLASPADWISPGRNDGYGENPPAWNEKKVSLHDTDHIWGVGGNPAWAWKSFLRGHNPIFMDPYDHSILGRGSPDDWIPLRKSLGVTRRLAQRVNLAAKSLLPPNTAWLSPARPTSSFCPTEAKSPSTCRVPMLGSTSSGFTPSTAQPPRLIQLPVVDKEP
jgi:hypothetical protein